MKNKRYILILITIICALAFSHPAFAAYEKRKEAKVSEEKVGSMKEPILEVGAMPDPFSSDTQAYFPPVCVLSFPYSH